MRNDDLVARLLDLNRLHSAEFSRPDARLARRRYRADHPTEIAALKCMDGRIHLPLITGTPLGIIQPWRNLGGRFDLGWPFFGRDLASWVEYAVDRGRRCLILVTHHFSRGDDRRGCAGFQYDTAAAKAFTATLRTQIEGVFGDRHEIVYPIEIGIETDLDALVLHGRDEMVVDLATLENPSSDDLVAILKDLYPDMPERMILDFLPLLLGNVAHIAEVRKSDRPVIDAEHRESVLGIGRGFDWLHTPNLALIVGPFNPNLDDPIRTAAGIIQRNITSGRIGKGFVLLASAAYRESAGIEAALAREKARYLRGFARDVIAEAYPDLVPLMRPLAVVVDLNTRKLEMLE